MDCIPYDASQYPNTQQGIAVEVLIHAGHVMPHILYCTSLTHGESLDDGVCQ